MKHGELDIKIQQNDDIFLITTEYDNGIYAEGETIEDALINFLDIYKIVNEIKGKNKTNSKISNFESYKLPVSFA